MGQMECTSKLAVSLVNLWKWAALFNFCPGWVLLQCLLNPFIPLAVLEKNGCWLFRQVMQQTPSCTSKPWIGSEPSWSWILGWLILNSWIDATSSLETFLLWFSETCRTQLSARKVPQVRHPRLPWVMLRKSSYLDKHSDSRSCALSPSQTLPDFQLLAFSSWTSFPTVSTVWKVDAGEFWPSTWDLMMCFPSKCALRVSGRETEWIQYGHWKI